MGSRRAGGPRAHLARGLCAACLPAEQQWLGSGGPRRVEVSPQPLSPAPGGGSCAGIEMEIVNSCEAANGGCSHGCSHSSEGPICTCPHGYELGEDQKTCIGASCPLPASGPGLSAAPSVPGFDASVGKLPPVTPSPALSALGGGGSGTRGLLRGSTGTPPSTRLPTSASGSAQPVGQVPTCCGMRGAPLHGDTHLQDNSPPPPVCPHSRHGVLGPGPVSCVFLWVWDHELNLGACDCVRVPATCAGVHVILCRCACGCV